MRYFCLLLILSAFSFPAMAQSKQQQSVASAVEKLRKAMIDGDRSALTAIAAEDLSYGHSSGLVENKADFVEHIASGKSDFVTIDLAEQTITVTDKVAIVRHVLNAAVNDNNTPATLKLRVILVWHREKGEWKLLARQAVKIS
jgi:ketosteroid isomerase-like protein